MPVEIGLWRLGERPEKLATSTLDAESVLENALEKDLSILAGGLMLVGRQVPTSYGKFIDIAPAAKQLNQAA